MQPTNTRTLVIFCQRYNVLGDVVKTEGTVNPYKVQVSFGEASARLCPFCRRLPQLATTSKNRRLDWSIGFATKQNARENQKISDNNARNESSDEGLGVASSSFPFPQNGRLIPINNRVSHTFTRPADVASTKPTKKRILELSACCCRGDKRRRVPGSSPKLNPLFSSMRP